jgi:uncharacterized YccA/Bax inhibitor family protein
MQQSSNPALSSKAFGRFASTDANDKMTVGGTLRKMGYAFAVLLVAAAVGWAIFPQFGVTIPVWTIWVGLGLTLVAGFWAAFKANVFSVTTYAILEGAYLGIVSRLFETAYNGIVLQAILITLAVTLGMFFLYSTGIVKVTQKLKSVIIIATVGVLIYLILELILSLVVPGFLTIVTSGVSGESGCALVISALKIPWRYSSSLSMSRRSSCHWRVSPVSCRYAATTFAIRFGDSPFANWSATNLASRR